MALARVLFFEPRVSLDGTVSCSRCHLVSLYATDSLPKAIGELFAKAFSNRKGWR